jgi:hypothetical protein
VLVPGGRRPVEVIARGQSGIFKQAGYSADDVTWAIVTMDDGAVLSLGISYALPSRYPTLGGPIASNCSAPRAR